MLLRLRHGVNRISSSSACNLAAQYRCVSAAANSIAAVRRNVDGASKSETTSVKGWVRSARHQKSISFLEVVDGSCMNSLQVILDASQHDSAALKTLTTGCSVEITGKLQPHPKHEDQCELHGEEFKLVGSCPPKEYPLQKKYHSLDFLRQTEMIHLRPRTNTIGAAARVRKLLGVMFIASRHPRGMTTLSLIFLFSLPSFPLV
mgnify:FL=1